MPNKVMQALLLMLLLVANALADDDVDDGLDDDFDDCRPELVEVQKQTLINYDPFLPGSTIVPIRFSISNEAGDDCELRLSVSLQGVLPTFDYEFSDTGVKIELRAGEDQQGISKSKTDGVFDLALDDEESREYVIDAVVAEDAVAAAQDHTLTLDFKLINADDASAPEVRWQADLVLRSLPRAQINLSGTTGGFGEVGSMSSVDFGIAKKGASRLVYLQLRSNTESILSVVSENRGVLKHKEEEDAPTISYTAELGDELIDLSKEYTRRFDLPKTYAGESHPLTLTLGDPSAAMSGKYSDIIVFEFSPL